MDLVGELNRLAGVRNAPQNYLSVNQATLATDTTGWGVSANATLTRAVPGTLRLPGVSGNYVSTPDAVDISIVGDIDIRCKVALDKWSSGTVQNIVSKYVAAGNQRSYSLVYDATINKIAIWISTDGTSVGLVSPTSSALTIPDGSVKWLRATYATATGAYAFYTSDDGVTWTGAGSGTTTISAIFDSTAPLAIGAYSDGSANFTQGYIYYADVRSGIGGAVVASFDASLVSPTDTRTPNSVVQSGRTWTLNGTLWSWPLAQSLAIHSAASGSAVARTPTGTGGFGVAPGRTYTAAADFLAGSAVRSVKMQMSWYDAAGTIIGSTITGPATADSTTVWTRASMSALAPDTAVYGNMLAAASATGAAGETHYIRNASYSEGGSGAFYNPSDTFGLLGEAGAANLWAGTTGLETVGALNAKAGLVVNGSSLEKNGILKRLGFDAYDQGGFTVSTLAGGVGVPGPGNASGGGLDNVLRLPGIQGNYASTPDSAALSITGDIDIRARVAADTWASGITVNLVAKWATQRSYRLGVGGTGGPFFAYSVDGTAQLLDGSTATLTTANGAAVWIRATHATGSGQTIFYTSPDGTTWTQLGATVAGTAGALFDGTAALEVGSRDSGAGSFAGQIYYAQVLNGIAGTPVATFDATTVAVRGDRTPSSFTGPQGNVWTINGTGWWWGTYTGTQRYTQAIQLASQYVYFDGTAGNYASTPDSAALSITGDIDLRVKLAPDSWTNGTTQTLLAKVGSDPLRTFRFTLGATGVFQWEWWVTGSNPGQSVSSTVPVPFTNGQTGWVRVTFDVDNGASGNTTIFYTSIDGVTWTQLGATRINAGVTSLPDTAAPVEIGAGFTGSSQPLTGKVYYAEIRNGIAGSIVGNFQPSRPAVAAVRNPTTITASTSEVWTINGSAWSWSPTLSPRITTPDSAALSIVGDLDVRVKATLVDWQTMQPTRAFLAKRTGATGGYQMRTANNGLLELVWSDGTTSFFRQSTVTMPFTSGQTGWVRGVLDVDNGAAGHDVKFYTSTDGITWTQLGATVTTAGVTSIGDATDPLDIGSIPFGSNRLDGATIYYAEIRNGIAGTVVGVFNPQIAKLTGTNTPTTLGSPTGETYTITGSGWNWVQQ